MSVLRRKLLRELYASKGLLLTVASIIAAGVSGYVTMQSAYYNLSGAKQRYYRQCRMADFWIDLKKAPRAELAVLADLAGVARIQPRIQFSVTVDLEGVRQPVNGLVISLPDRRRRVINDVVLRRGGYFTGRQPNEVILNDAFARRHGLAPGGRIRVLMNQRRQELRIVGTAISSEFTYLVGPGSFVPDPENFGVLYVPRTFAEDVFDFRGAANQVVGQLAPGAAGRVDDVLRRAERRLDAYGVTATTPRRRQISNQFLSGEIRGLYAFAAILPAMFLAVAAVVLNVVASRLARRQRAVIGTFKAMGYTDGRMAWHFLQLGLLVGAAGGLAGDLFGAWMAVGMTRMYRIYFEFPDLRSEPHWAVYAVGFLVSLVFAGLGVLRGARAVLRLQPAEAMRPEPPGRGGPILLERVRWAWRRLSASWRAVLRSLVRHRVRTSAAVFAAAMGAALLVGGLAMFESMEHLIDFQFFRVTASDIDVTFSREQSEAAVDELRRLPGVDWAEPLLAVPCDLIHGARRRKAGLIGLPPDARLYTPCDRSGRPIRPPPGGLVLPRRLAQILDVRPGQRVTVRPVRGARRPADVVVSQIADSYLGLEAYADLRTLSRLVDEELAVSGAKLQVNGRPDDLRRLYQRLKATPAVESVVSRRRMIDNLMELMFEYQYVSFGVLVGFAGLIYFGGVLNASLVNLAERQRETATYLALGYSEWRVGGLFLRESLATNLAGTLIGMPLGYGLMGLTAWFYNSDVIRLPVVTAPWIWIVTIACSLTFTLAAHAVVQRSIFRMDFVGALNVKE